MTFALREIEIGFLCHSNRGYSCHAERNFILQRSLDVDCLGYRTDVRQTIIGL